MRKYATHDEYRAAEMMAIVISVIRFYCECKQKMGIVPARAKWRELRFSFSRHAATSLQKITADELWNKLHQMILGGYVREYDTINFPTYELVKEKVSTIKWM